MISIQHLATLADKSVPTLSTVVGCFECLHLNKQPVTDMKQQCTYIHCLISNLKLIVYIKLKRWSLRVITWGQYIMKKLIHHILPCFNYTFFNILEAFGVASLLFLLNIPQIVCNIQFKQCLICMCKGMEFDT